MSQAVGNLRPRRSEPARPAGRCKGIGDVVPREPPEGDRKVRHLEQHMLGRPLALDHAATHQHPRETAGPPVPGQDAASRQG